MTIGRRWVLVGLLTFTGCGGPGDATPSVLHTDHLEVDPSDSEVLCRGSLDGMEAQAVRVADILQLGFPSIIRVGYGDSAVEELCGSKTAGYGGCVRGLFEETKVAGDYASIYHELVHAVRAINGIYGSWFFEEGIAVVLGGFPPHGTVVDLVAADVERTPEMLVALPRSEVLDTDYGIAAHFMQWLLDTFGDEIVVAFLNDEAFLKDAGAAFADHFGLTLREAEEAWRATSEDQYTFGGVCDPERALTWTDPAFEFTGRVDCDAPNTTGPSYDKVKTRSHCFSLPEPGVPRVEMDAPVGEARFVHVGCSGPNANLTPEHFQPKSILAGEALDLPFAACTWEIAVDAPLAQPIDVAIRMTRP